MLNKKENKSLFILTRFWVFMPIFLVWLSSC